MPSSPECENAVAVSHAAAEDGKASRDEVSAPSLAKDSGRKATVLDLTGSSPRSSSSPSEVGENVPSTAASMKSQQSASEEGISTAQSLTASPDQESSDPLAPSILGVSSPPPAIKPSQPTQRRTRASTSMVGNAEPSAKRPRGPPRKAAPKDTLSRGDVGDIFEDELALESGRHQDKATPEKGLRLGQDSARRGRPAGRSREEPTWKWELKETGLAPSRIRVRASVGLVDKDRYEPLHIYENSNWAVFDPIKSFPDSLPDPPELLKHFTHYNLGNDRILEYKLVSNSIRLKWTPKVLGGKSVRYGSHGPRLE